MDDQKDIGDSLERLLRYAGHEAVAVTGGAESLAMLRVRKLSLLVLDVNMPATDRLSVLKTMSAFHDCVHATPYPQWRNSPNRN